MYGSRLGSAASLRSPSQNLHPFPPLALEVHSGAEAPSQLFCACCVQGQNNNNYGLVKVSPGGGSVLFVKNLPLASDQTLIHALPVGKTVTVGMLVPSV